MKYTVGMEIENFKLIIIIIIIIIIKTSITAPSGKDKIVYKFGSKPHEPRLHGKL